MDPFNKSNENSEKLDTLSWKGECLRTEDDLLKRDREIIYSHSHKEISRPKSAVWKKQRLIFKHNHHQVDCTQFSNYCNIPVIYTLMPGNPWFSLKGRVLCWPDSSALVLAGTEAFKWKQANKRQMIWYTAQIWTNTLYINIYIQDIGAGILEERRRPSYFCWRQIRRDRLGDIEASWDGGVLLALECQEAPGVSVWSLAALPGVI